MHAVSETPDVAGVVLGWRRWQLEGRDDGGPIRLASPLAPLHESPSWPAGHPKAATCPTPHMHRDAGADPAPVVDCTCGLYAATEVGHACAAAPGEVLGCVALWGTVIEGERGYRAARGYPQVLYAEPSVSRDERAELAARYQVPVYPIAMLDLLPPARRRLRRLGQAVEADIADHPRIPAAAGTGHDPRGSGRAEPSRDGTAAQALAAGLWRATLTSVARATVIALLAVCAAPLLWAAAARAVGPGLGELADWPTAETLAAVVYLGMVYGLGWSGLSLLWHFVDWRSRVGPWAAWIRHVTVTVVTVVAATVVAHPLTGLVWPASGAVAVTVAVAWLLLCWMLSAGFAAVLALIRVACRRRGDYLDALPLAAVLMIVVGVEVVFHSVWQTTGHLPGPWLGLLVSVPVLVLLLGAAAGLRHRLGMGPTPR